MSAARLLVPILAATAVGVAAGWWLRGAPETRPAPAPTHAPGKAPGKAPAPAPAKAPSTAPRVVAPRMVDQIWTDATLAQVVNDLVGRTGRQLQVSDKVRKRLETIRITLHVEDELVTHVLANVLRPHELGYSVRATEVLIFPDDD